MKYLLDTNIVSELRKPKPDSNVLAWFNKIKPEQLFLSCLTIGELKYCAIKILKQDEHNGKLLVKWVDTLLEEYEEQIVNVDLDTCQKWSELLLINNTAVVDSLLAAQALVNDMILVSSNSKHLAIFGMELLNPFEPKK